MVLRDSSSLLLTAVAALALASCSGGSEEEAAQGDAEPAALVGSTSKTATTAAASATPDFGDDNGNFARDGECDDMRFEGPGMTSTPLIEEDIRHDASDCRTAYEQGRLTLKGSTTSATLASAPVGDVNRIQWGDDNGDFSNDGECDDKRFTGAGMTTTTLLDSDIKHDATDCRTAFEQGRLALR